MKTISKEKMTLKEDHEEWDKSGQLIDLEERVLREMEWRLDMYTWSITRNHNHTDEANSFSAVLNAK